MNVHLVHRSVSITVTERGCRTVVTAPTTAIVTVKAAGPQGPPGPIGSGIVNADILQPAQTLSEDVTLGENRNGLSVGPVTVASGVTITVPSGAIWLII